MIRIINYGNINLTCCILYAYFDGQTDLIMDEKTEPGVCNEKLLSNSRRWKVILFWIRNAEN